MASLAVLLKNKGHRITGSDQNIYPPMSTFLEENGIAVMPGFKAENLVPHPDVVIIGNALSRGNAEVEYALTNHLNYQSMAEVLKNEFIRGRTSVVITGTHGKTTTTSLVSHLLDYCGLDPGFMIGGIPGNFDTSARDTDSGKYFVVEGDEYDSGFFDKRSKFFHYLPDRLVINNIEFDHADIFSSLDEIKKAFTLMLRQIPEDGLILVNGDDSDAMEVAKKGFSPVISFGIGEECDYRIREITQTAGKLQTRFQLWHKGEKDDYTIPLLGEFNTRNATAAILIAIHEGVPPEKIKEALLGFKNTKRRLQPVNHSGSTIHLFDDFAHHPTAIEETIRALRSSWPQAKIHAVYQARSNTSVRNYFQDRMHTAFRDADNIIFYKLHREESIPVEQRLNIDSIVEKLEEEGKTAHHLKEIDLIVDSLDRETQSGDIVVFLSQGDFGGVQLKVAERLKQK